MESDDGNIVEVDEWEIDASKLIIKQSLPRGTYGGSVYHGLYNGQEVVVKVLQWKEEDRRNVAKMISDKKAFRQEVSVWYNLDHPNICKCVGAKMGKSGIKFQTDGGQIQMETNVYGIISDYIPGGTLKSYLRANRGKKLAFRTVMQISLDLARGISYLHSKNIVHRDIKTENLLLDDHHRLKITDFGVARFEANEMTGVTGTIIYMAPEVIDSKPYSRKCDVYSFGICLWEIYCCDMPYSSFNFNFAQFTYAVVYQGLRPEIPKSCPSELANVMKRCWDADPDKRPGMEEIVSMLEAIDEKHKKKMSFGLPSGCLCLRS